MPSLAAVAFLAVVLAACSGREAPSAPPPSAPAGEPALQPAEPIAEPPPAIDAGPPLDEAAARVLLAERFRAAGHRIRHDVRVTSDGAYDVTLDGFDPDEGVGFEYVAPEEAGTDLTADERDAIAAAGDLRVLVLDAADAATVGAAADAFLGGP